LRMSQAIFMRRRPSLVGVHARNDARNELRILARLCITPEKKLEACIIFLVIGIVETRF
jgi:hypothetical protein